MGLAQIGIALPNFWFAILLILLFAVQLQWFPAGGFPGWRAEDGGGLWPGLHALVLPALSLAVVQGAILARVTRSAVLDVLREDFVRTARAKGLSPRATLWRHVLRNALVPVVTVMGLQFANLLAAPSWWRTCSTCPAWAVWSSSPSPTATWWWCATASCCWPRWWWRSISSSMC